MNSMIEYRGLSIGTEEGVYTPADDSLLAAGLVADFLVEAGRNNLSLLDMGTGTGILGLAACSTGRVSDAVFADANPDAVALARRNAEKNGIDGSVRCSFLESDLFGAVDGKFDIIAFNPPYLRSEDGGREGPFSWWDGGSRGIDTTVEFLRGAVTHLKDGGVIFVVYSSLSDVTGLEEEIARLGMMRSKTTKTHVFFEDIVAAALVRADV